MAVGVGDGVETKDVGKAWLGLGFGVGGDGCQVVDAVGGTDGCNSMGAGVDVRGYVFAARLIKANTEAAQGEQEINGMEGKRHNSHIRNLRYTYRIRLPCV